MRGFCHTGILLFPKVESYEFRNESYHLCMRKSLKAIIDYFQSVDITLAAFTSDEVAILANPANMYWIQALPPEDAFFVKNNCDNMGKTFTDVEEHPAIYAEAKKKFPIARGLSREQRFEIVLKRNNFITKKIIEQSRLIVHFVTHNNVAYKINPKVGDNKIIININNGDFLMKCYLNGAEVDAIPLLGLPYANRPLMTWEVIQNGFSGN